MLYICPAGTSLLDGPILRPEFSDFAAQAEDKLRAWA